MTRATMRALASSAVLTGVLGGGIGAAAADPSGPPAQEIELTCGETTYDVVVNGNGIWGVAHDTASNTIFVPTAFGDFHGTVLDPAGNVVEEFVDEGDFAKGQSAKNKGDILECTFSFVEVSDGSDPEFPLGFTFIGEGEVSGFATPRR